jgi:hypothetical protein
MRRSGVPIQRPYEKDDLDHAAMNCRIARERAESNKARATIRALTRIASP